MLRMVFIKRGRGARSYGSIISHRHCCDSIVGMGVARRGRGGGRVIRAKRKAREYAMVVRALADTSHPVLAQIVPARFCNLSCGYCNEYDKVSEPVPLDEMYRRIDA